MCICIADSLCCTVEANTRRRQWHPTPVLLPGKSHGWRRLVGCSPWGRQSWTRLSDFTFMQWRRKWQPTPVFLPGESQGRGSLVGCRLWGRTESDTTEATQQQQQQKLIQNCEATIPTLKQQQQILWLNGFLRSCVSK